LERIKEEEFIKRLTSLKASASQLRKIWRELQAEVLKGGLKGSVTAGACVLSC